MVVRINYRLYFTLELVRNIDCCSEIVEHMVCLRIYVNEVNAWFDKDKTQEEKVQPLDG